MPSMCSCMASNRALGSGACGPRARAGCSNPCAPMVWAVGEFACQCPEPVLNPLPAAGEEEVETEPWLRAPDELACPSQPLVTVTQY